MVDILTVANYRGIQGDQVYWTTGDIDAKTANMLMDVDSVPFVVVANLPAVANLAWNIASTLGRAYPPSLIAQIPVDWLVVRHQEYDYTGSMYDQCIQLVGDKSPVFRPTLAKQLSFIEETFLLKHLGQF